MPEKQLQLSLSMVHTRTQTQEAMRNGDALALTAFAIYGGNVSIISACSSLPRSGDRGQDVKEKAMRRAGIKWKQTSSFYFF